MAHLITRHFFGKVVIRITLGVALLLTSMTHAADTVTNTVIYKWKDKNGVVSFSQEKPTDPDARDISMMTVQTLPSPQQDAAKRMLFNMEEPDNRDFEARQQRLKDADLAVDKALRQLQRAERNLKRGSIPTGYDRVGNVNGRARLRESYFYRVSELQQKVDQARDDLNDAYTARDQLYPTQ